MTETILRILALLAEEDMDPPITQDRAVSGLSLRPGQGRGDRIRHRPFLRRVAPVLRLMTTLLAIVLCALSRNAVFVLILLAAGLLRLAFLPGRGLIRVLRRVLPPFFFSVLILLPAALLGHPRTLLTISMKVLTTLTLLALRSEDLSWKEITASLQALHMPQLFILTLDMTVRFLVLMGRLSQSLYEALVLRTVSWSGNRYDRARMQAAGGILGTVFLRSTEMAVEVSEAMECRCFDGTFRIYEKHRPEAADLIYGALLPVLLFLFVTAGR